MWVFWVKKGHSLAFRSPASTISELWGVSGSGCGVACGLRTLFCLTVPVQSLGSIRSFGFVAVVARPTSK